MRTTKFSMALPASSSTKVLLLLSLLATISVCSAIDLGRKPRTVDEVSPLFDHDDNGVFSVLGIAGLGDATPYPRREIRDLEKNYPDQWNIYLLGLKRFQSVDQSDKLSYFQIAGIHGRPWIPWDGVEGDSMSLKAGYCTHSSNLFPTWHRPYMALFEEAWYLNARQVISEFTEGDMKVRYTNALRTAKIPYWDWAAIPPAGERSMPASLQKEFVDINLPNGTITIANPLCSYKFHPVPDWQEEKSQRWKLWSQTLRHPTSNVANAVSRNDMVATALDSNRKSMQSRVYDMLSLQNDYTPFSNKMVKGDSLESIHGTIHDMVGADGHMLWLQYSAFDPIFWLHHANVDRLITIWQEVHPDSWVSAFNNSALTYTTKPYSIADSQTPLKPFHKDDSGQFWNSDDVRRWQTFGYTYAEVENLTSTDTIISRVNALYGPNAAPLLSAPPSSPPSYPSLKRAIATTSGAANFAGCRQYTLNIIVREQSVNGSIKIYVFFGNPSTYDTTAWPEDPELVGVTSILASSKEIEGAQEANTVVPLTAALEAKVRLGEVRSMEESVIREYLRERVTWKVVQTDGDIVGCEEVPGIQVWVTWQEIEPAKSAHEFPKFSGDLEVLFNATESYDGGYC